MRRPDPPRTVLVTGVSRRSGDRLARALADDLRVERVVGVDVVPPRGDIGAAEFVRADLRSPGLTRVLEDSGADTVVHAGVVATAAHGRSTMKEINVIGTMQLLAACQRLPGLRRLVVRSSASVYGAGPRDPALFREDTEPSSPPRVGWARDMVDIEADVAVFARRRPDVEVTVLRPANVLGAVLDTPMSAYFALPVVPTVLGHDARMHFLHEDDLVAALHHAAVAGVPGTFNVAGSGVLMLSQTVRTAGRVALPLVGPAVSAVGTWFARPGLDLTADRVDYLRYGRGLDLTRCRDELGFVPQRSTRETFDAFVGSALTPGGSPFTRDRVGALERGLAHALGFRTLAERTAAGSAAPSERPERLVGVDRG